MRLLLAPALIAILALPVPLRAQQQERKLLDRIQRPNMELTNPMQAKSFEGGGGVQMKSANIGKTPYDAGKRRISRSFRAPARFWALRIHGLGIAFSRPRPPHSLARPTLLPPSRFATRRWGDFLLPTRKPKSRLPT